MKPRMKIFSKVELDDNKKEKCRTNMCVDYQDDSIGICAS